MFHCPLHASLFRGQSANTLADLWDELSLYVKEKLFDRLQDKHRLDPITGISQLTKAFEVTAPIYGERGRYSLRHHRGGDSSDSDGAVLSGGCRPK